MRKKDNTFGSYIEGVTDIHKREWLEKYIDWKSWTSADNWLHTELCYLHKKVLRGRVIYYTFGALMSVVMAFFTWVVFFAKADETELAVFPLATSCNNLYIKLCQMVPGGAPTVITGLLLIPFLVSVIIAVVFCFDDVIYIL